MKNKEPVVLPRLLAMATVAGAFIAISAPAQAAPMAFASSIDAKLAPIAASLVGTAPDGIGAQGAFVELGFVQFYSRIKPPKQNDFDLTAAPIDRPSALEAFRAIASLT
ncbi:MAG: hypothetical protein MUF34_27130 [Polyangiaceae bacterium]|jgi:hypothetical protein|nr:hypothetical protein [Polyangiaceae bacterium]